MTADLDEIDKAVIRELQIDGRLPYSQLSAVTGLSEAATRQRVNRLIDRGVMSIVAVTDPATLGYGFQAMLGITVDAQASAIAEKLAQIDKDGLRDVHFAWAGPDKPGIGHYYRIQGPSFLILLSLGRA